MFDRVEADYDQLDNIANQFGNQGDVLQQMLAKVQSAMEALTEGGWEGRGSDAFYQEMEGEVLPASQRLQQAMEEAQRVTQYISQTMQQAEDDACSPFRVR